VLKRSLRVLERVKGRSAKAEVMEDIMAKAMKTMTDRIKESEKCLLI